MFLIEILQGVGRLVRSAPPPDPRYRLALCARHVCPPHIFWPGDAPDSFTLLHGILWSVKWSRNCTRFLTSQMYFLMSNDIVTTQEAKVQLQHRWWISLLFDIPFSAFTLLVGWQEGHLASINRVVGCWHGYLPGARCRFAYGPADATATHLSLEWWKPHLAWWVQWRSKCLLRVLWCSC